MRTLTLRNLTPDEGRAYLLQRRVPAEDLPAVLDFTHSYPLALSLVADLYDQRPGFHFQPLEAVDVVKLLLEQFLQRARPGAPRRVGGLRAGTRHHRGPLAGFVNHGRRA